MRGLVRRQFHLDPVILADFERLVKSKGGRKQGYSLSREVNKALQAYVRQATVEREEVITAPVWRQMLDEKFEQLETWLRPGVWGGATYSTTAALLLLELMCGKTLDPRQAKDHFALIRGRAWKIVRREFGPGNPTGRDEDE